MRATRRRRRSAAFFTNALVADRARSPASRAPPASASCRWPGPGIGTGFYRLDRPTPDPGELPVTDVRPVTPDFFRTMGIPQLAGRDFTAADAADAPLVAIVSEDLVRRSFRARDPLGKRLHVPSDATTA